MNRDRDNHCGSMLNCPATHYSTNISREGLSCKHGYLILLVICCLRKALSVVHMRLAFIDRKTNPLRFVARSEFHAIRPHLLAAGIRHNLRLLPGAEGRWGL
jgi:hypothetical protein